MQRHRCRPGSNKGPEKRLLCSDLIKVRWADQQGAPREEIAVLEAYSVFGASLLMGVPVLEGTHLTLCGGTEEFLAKVRHCVPAPNGYMAGVTFGDQSRRYVPEHLLDLSRLICPPKL